MRMNTSAEVAIEKIDRILSLLDKVEKYVVDMKTSTGWELKTREIGFNVVDMERALIDVRADAAANLYKI